MDGWLWTFGNNNNQHMTKKSAILISTVIVILLSASAYIAPRYYSWHQSKSQSEALVSIHNTARFNMQVNYQFFDECINSDDPWVRANLAGTLSSVGLKCRDEDLTYVNSMIDRLKADDDDTVRRAAKTAGNWIKDVRADYRARKLAEQDGAPNPLPAE